jgi:hypothetical protein
MAREHFVRARVSLEEKEAIERQARKQDRDVSNLIRHRLRPDLEADERERNARERP